MAGGELHPHAGGLLERTRPAIAAFARPGMIRRRRNRLRGPAIRIRRRAKSVTASKATLWPLHGLTAHRERSESGCRRGMEASRSPVLPPTTKAELLVGKRIRRREDPRLITGTATYVEDIQMPVACITRSSCGARTRPRKSARSRPAMPRRRPEWSPCSRARTRNTSGLVPCGASLARPARAASAYSGDRSCLPRRTSRGGRRGDRQISGA